MERRLVAAVWERAGHRCEYCCMPQVFDEFAFQVDHVIAISHGGPTHADNLCLACFHCNSFKGPNLSGLDPQSGRVVPLFHPRRQAWRRHFEWCGPLLHGRTAAGRTTIVTLRINMPLRAAHRQMLMIEGEFPPW